MPDPAARPPGAATLLDPWRSRIRRTGSLRTGCDSAQNYRDSSSESRRRQVGTQPILVVPLYFPVSSPGCAARNERGRPARTKPPSVLLSGGEWSPRFGSHSTLPYSPTGQVSTGEGVMSAEEEEAPTEGERSGPSFSL